MEQLTGRIAGHGGMVVDYAGDGILAVWNAPEEIADHAARACTTALEMHAEMEGLNRRWAETLGAPLEIGIGVHTGTALVGNAGSRWKAKYGPIGDTVNLASRIEGATKHLGVPVLISESTRRAVGVRFPLRRLCLGRLAGMIEPVNLYELHVGEDGGGWEALRDDYEAALEAFEEGCWARAGQGLQHHLTQPNSNADRPDMPTLALLGRVVECLKAPKGFAFSPVWEFGSK
jgi:adenylate cyclase